MESLLEMMHSHVAVAPWIIFGALLLAGLNIPVSEDAMLFISAYLASTHPEHAVALFVAVYAGAYCSDVICFSLGWFLGNNLWRSRLFSSMVTEERVAKVASFYDRYGVWTLIFGRFIPFGVRNALFLTAGIGKMSPVRFALADGLAATISTVFFFSLYYVYGKSVIEYVRQGNMIVFGTALVAVVGFFVWKKRQARAET